MYNPLVYKRVEGQTIPKSILSLCARLPNQIIPIIDLHSSSINLPAFYYKLSRNLISYSSRYLFRARQ